MDIFENKYFIAICITLIFIYSALIGPNLPNNIKKVFNNPIFRIFILFFIAIYANKCPLIALFIAFAYIVTVTYLNEQDIKEKFKNLN
jgi:hypothetical protein